MYISHFHLNLKRHLLIKAYIEYEKGASGKVKIYENEVVNNERKS